MKTIMIDLDDTIVTSGFKELFKKFTNNEICIEDNKEFYLEKLLPENKQKEFVNFILDNNTYDYVDFIKDAKEVIERLNKKYEIYICSAYVFKYHYEISGKILNQKYEWILKNMPFIDPKHIIFCNAKEVIDVDIKIDDKVSNLKTANDLKILFTAYHNTHNAPIEELNEKKIVRANSWIEVEELINNLYN